MILQLQQSSSVALINKY